MSQRQTADRSRPMSSRKTGDRSVLTREKLTEEKQMASGKRCHCKAQMMQTGSTGCSKGSAALESGGMNHPHQAAIENYLESLRGQYRDLENSLLKEINRLKKKLDAKNHEGDAQSSLIEQIKKERDLNQQLARKEEASWKEHYSALASENATIRHRLKRRDKENEELKQQIQRMEEQMEIDEEEERANIIRANDARNKAEMQQEILERQLEESNTSYEELREQFNDQKKETTKYDNLVQQLRQEQDVQQNKCRELQDTISRLETQLQSERAAAEKARESLTSEKQKVTQLEEENADLKTQINELQQQCDDADAECREFQKTAEGARADEHRLEQKCNQLNEELQNAEERNHELNMQYQKLEKRYHAKVAEHENLHNKHQALEEQYNQLDVELESHAAEIDSLQQNLDLAKERDQQSMEELHEIQEQYSKTFADKEGLEKELADIRARYNSCVGVLESINSSHVMEQNYAIGQAVRNALEKGSDESKS